MVFGAMDGVVSTFAVVAGTVGAGLAPGAILVVGAAALLADALSMAGANYLATRTDAEARDSVRADEEAQIEAFPAGEREEIRQIFARKGFEGADLERVVEVITGDRELWIETMLREEHGLARPDRSAARAALATFAAFAGAGAAPLLPFVVALGAQVAAPAFAASVLLAGTAFLGIGAARGVLVGRPWMRSAIEALLIGAAASSVALAVGRALRGVADAV